MPRNLRRNVYVSNVERGSASQDANSRRLTLYSGKQQSSTRRGQHAATASTSLDPNKQSIRLTVKAPPSRLREVTTNNSSASREKLGRSSKRAPIIDKSESDEDDEIEDDEEAEGLTDEDEEEEEDDEEDEQDEISTPRIKINAPTNSKKPSPGRVLKQGVPTKSVEDKEMQGASSEEELSSELDDDAEGEDEEAEGEDDEDMEMLDDDGADIDDTINSAAIGEDELDSEAEGGSESGTPDPSKLTRRQRGEAESDLMALSNEAQKKKFFTAEQITMRRAEMARRRKDLSDKRNQNEKEDTLRRLLHKPAPKRRSRAQMIADAEREEFGTPGAEGEEPRPSKLYMRTVMRVDGSSVSLPEEWLGTPAARLLEKTVKQGKREGDQASSISRMVEVID